VPVGSSHFDIPVMEDQARFLCPALPPRLVSLQQKLHNTHWLARVSKETK